MIALLPHALALPPLHDDGTIDVGNGTLQQLAWSVDGAWMAGQDRATSSAFVLHIDGWTVETVAPCAVRSVTPAASLGEQRLYVGCDDGRIFGYAVERETVVPIVDPTGSALSWQLLDAERQPALDPIVALAWNGDPADPLLFALGDATPAGEVHVVEINTGATDDAVFAGWPALAAGTGIVGSATSDQGNLYFVHGARDTTIVGLATGTVSFSPLVPGGQLYTIDGIAPAASGRLWAADGTLDAIFTYHPLQGTFSATYLGMGAPTVLSHNTDPDDPWLLTAGDAIRVYATSGTSLPDPNEPLWNRTEPPYTVSSLLAGPDYSFAGTTDGTLRVLSARPWIDALELVPDAGLPGDTVTLGFRLPRPADWSVWLNGDRTGSGTALASGSTSAPDEAVSLTFTVDESWAEGTNRIYVLATGDNLLPGHARATFQIDTVPDAPVLDPADLGFGSRRLRLSFVASSIADLDHYLVYVSDVPFDPEDYPTGGPPPPADGPDSPLRVTAEPGAAVTIDIAPLINGVTYAIAIRAVDAGGQESPMSNVITGTPREGRTASALAGETGGCATAPAGGSFSVALGLLALLRRSSSLALLGFLLAPAARAEERETGDMTKQRGNVELRYGPYLSLNDPNITDVYGTSGHELLQLEAGPQLTRFVEVDLEVGFYQELAFALDANGEPSVDRTMLTAFPFGLSGTFRLHVVDEQLFVPYARVGLGALHFTELTDDGAGGKNRVYGMKFGQYHAFGLNILLDILDRGRASLLEAQTGINDTYLCIEWRRQAMDSRTYPWSPTPASPEGFVFSGDLLTVGLKLDY